MATGRERNLGVLGNLDPAAALGVLFAVLLVVDVGLLAAAKARFVGSRLVATR